MDGYKAILTICVLLLNEAKGMLNDNFILVGDSGHGSTGLYQVDMETGNTLQILPEVPSSVVGVAYNPRDQTFFYSDFRRNSIMQYSTRPQATLSVLYQEHHEVGSSHFEGLVFDGMNNKLYYTNNRKASNRHIEGVIGEIDVRTKTQRIYLRHGKVEPRAIQVDIHDRKLYFTDCEKEPGIYRLPMDGKAGTNVIDRIVSNNLHWPNGLTIDVTARVMYWANVRPGEYPSRIEMANLDGTGRRILLEERNAHYFGLALDSTHLYITDWKFNKIRRMDRSNNSMSTVSSTKRFGKLFGIAVYVSSELEQDFMRMLTTETPQNLSSDLTTTSVTSPSPSSTVELSKTASTSFKFTTRGVGDSTSKQQILAAIVYSSEEGDNAHGSLASTMMQTFNNPLILGSSIVVIVAVIVGVTVCCVVKSKRKGRRQVTSDNLDECKDSVRKEESLGFHSDDYAFIPADHFKGDNLALNEANLYLKLAQEKQNTNMGNLNDYEKPSDFAPYAKLAVDQSDSGGYLEPWQIL